MERLMKFGQFATHAPHAPRTRRARIDHRGSIDPLHHQVAPIVADLEDLRCGAAVRARELHGLGLG